MQKCSWPWRLPRCPTMETSESYVVFFYLYQFCFFTVVRRWTKLEASYLESVSNLSDRKNNTSASGLSPLHVSAIWLSPLPSNGGHELKADLYEAVFGTDFLAVSKHFSYLRWKCASSLFTCRRGCRHRGVTNQKLNGYIWDLCCSHPTFKLFRQFCRLLHFFPPPCLASPSDDLITRLARKGEKCAWDNRNLSPIRMIRDRCKKIF